MDHGLADTCGSREIGTAAVGDRRHRIYRLKFLTHSQQHLDETFVGVYGGYVLLYGGYVLLDCSSSNSSYLNAPLNHGAALITCPGRRSPSRPSVAVARKRPTLPRAGPFPQCGRPVCYIGMLVGL